MSSGRNLLILGSPGSGKSSLCNLLRSKGYTIIAMGDLIRREIQAQTPLGMKIREATLIPDELAFQLFIKNFDSKEPFAVEGFPSTMHQYQLFLDFLKQRNLLHAMDVIYLNCPPALAIERMVNRLICSGCPAIYNGVFDPPDKAGLCNACGGIVHHRHDDTLENAKRRLEIFQTITFPIVLRITRVG